MEGRESGWLPVLSPRQLYLYPRVSHNLLVLEPVIGVNEVNAVAVQCLTQGCPRTPLWLSVSHNLPFFFQREFQ